MDRWDARLAAAFERALWLARFVVLLPVVFCGLLALAGFYVATVDALSVFGSLRSYGVGSATAHHSDLHANLVTGIVKSVDVYLLAIVLLIVALGLYELFVSKITIAESSEIGSRVLLIRSLDDLKDRLAKTVLLVLVVEFLQQALNLSYGSPLDLLYLAVGILLVGAAIYLTGRKASNGHSQPGS